MADEQLRQQIEADDEELREMLDFLDLVRESGTINMFGAAPELEDAFYLDREQARLVLQYWMRTFGERKAVQP